MTISLQELQSAGSVKGFAKIKSGQTVRIHEQIQEGQKSRIQIFEGLVIKTGGSGLGLTITVRKIIGGIGVEKLFTPNSPSIVKVEITKEAKVRRSRLFFMRERKGKSARLKEKFLTQSDLRSISKESEKTKAETNEKAEAGNAEKGKENSQD